MGLTFMDVVIIISVFCMEISFVLSLYFFRRKKAASIFICSIVTGIVAWITWQSYGMYIVVIAIIQLYFALHLLYKKKKKSP